MVTKKRKSASHPAEEKATIEWRRTAVSLAVAAALPGAGLLSSPVMAQESTEQEPAAEEELMEEVVAYGKFRASLVDAISSKRDSATIVEAISAEDIGKLPDSSIAESLARLPGLAGERRNGRTSGISVRGFREDYVGVTMNGRELLGIGDNRGVEFDLYPSEIISGVLVYKTPDAGMTTQGIGGIVDLRTTRPLDVDPFLAVNGNFEQNNLDSANPDFDDNGYRFALSYSEKFMDDRVGLALALATTESPSQEEQFRGWGYPTIDPANAAPGVTLDGSETVVAGHDSFVRSAVLERDTVTGVLQFEPRDDLTVTLDALYIDFSEEKAFRGVEEGGAVWGTGAYTVTGVENGLVTAGEYDGFLSVIRNDAERRDAELTAFGMNIEYDLGEEWKLTFDAAVSQSDKTITNIESYSGVGRASSATQGSQTPRSFVMTPSGAFYGAHSSLAPVDLGDFNTIRLAGPQAWGGALSNVSQFQPQPAFPNIGPSQAQDGFVNEPIFDEELTTIKLEAERPMDLGIVSNLKVGVYFSEREKSKDNGGAFLTAPTFPEDGLIPEEFRFGTADLSFLGLGDVVAYDSLGLFDSGFYIATDAALLQPDREGDTYIIDEQLLITYGQIDFDTQIADRALYGNLGVQIVNVDQQGSGFDSRIGQDLFVTASGIVDGDDYTDVLPSLNVNYEIAEGHVIRAAASKTVSRPRLDDMRPNNQVSFNFNFANVASTDPENGPWSATAGNARLQPL
ncbi:MAG: TonB-dependent receptor, partial [Pseudomonadota bacterium]